MYTQMLKEILLTIDFQQEHVSEFLTYCRELFLGNPIENTLITHPCFLYSMLNRALRMMEVDLIIKMGFFVRDLHNYIVALHAEQYGGENQSDSFIVYRGQGLTKIDFDQLKSTVVGLVSFNNFFSYSTNASNSSTYSSLEGGFDTDCRQ